MIEQKFNMYVHCLQSHPSVAHTNKSAELLKYIPKWLPLGNGKKRRSVLALGCADGAEVKALNDLGYSATGITLGQCNVDYGKKNYGNIDIRVMDMHDLKFRPRAFDYAYSSHCFEHSFAPWIHVMEVWSVLKEFGLWYTQHPTYVEGTTEVTMQSHHHPNVLPPEIHRHIFEECGFKVIKYEQQGGREDNWLLQKSKDNPMHDAIKTAYLEREFLHSV